MFALPALLGGVVSAMAQVSPRAPWPGLAGEEGGYPRGLHGVGHAEEEGLESRLYWAASMPAASLAGWWMGPIFVLIVVDQASFRWMPGTLITMADPLGRRGRPG